MSNLAYIYLAVGLIFGIYHGSVLLRNKDHSPEFRGAFAALSLWTGLFLWPFGVLVGLLYGVDDSWEGWARYVKNSAHRSTVLIEFFNFAGLSY